MNSQFETAISDPATPVALDLSADSDALLVAFGGIAGALGITPFEFFRLGKKFNTNKIYIRDLNQSWYQRGLPGISMDIDGTADYLREQITKSGSSRSVFVGNSMGGYAAIVFGLLAGADTVFAFSPQTFIDEDNRDQYRDRRWEQQIVQTHAYGTGRYLDLIELLAAHEHSCAINIYYSETHTLDRIHAERLQDYSNITLNAFDDGGHEVVKVLRDSGELYRLLETALKDH